MKNNKQADKVFLFPCILINCILIIVFGFVGCRTHKATLAQDISATQETVVTLQNDEHTNTHIQNDETRTIETEQLRMEDVTTIEYSAPDTTGRQFITRIVMSNSKNETLQSEIIERFKSINQQIAVKTQMDEITNLQTHESIQAKESIKSHTPAWVYFVCSVVLGVICIFIYIVINKFKK
jgi:cell division protein FtsX